MSSTSDVTPRPASPLIEVFTKDMSGPIGGDDPDCCRICRGEGNIEQPLFYPCKCSGSIKFVHQDCLMRWLAHTQKKHCELCKTPFRFTKLYDQAMPDTVPIPIFLHRIALHAASTAIRYARYVLVFFLWTACLPYFVRHVWRGLFWIADGSWMTTEEMQAYFHQHKTRIGHGAGAEGLPDVTANSEPLHPLWSTYLKSVAGYVNFLDLFQPPLSPGNTTGEAWHQDSNSTSQPTAVIDLVRNTTSYVRAPSLLSDSLVLQSLTRYPTVNGILIDVAEGQLICLLVVAAFILIFLIREWVVGQQPVADMPNPDRLNLPQPARPNVDPLAQQRQRRLRRPAPAAANIRLQNAVAAQEDHTAFHLVPTPHVVDGVTQVAPLEDAGLNRPDVGSSTEPSGGGTQETTTSSRALDLLDASSPASELAGLELEEYLVSVVSADQSPLVASSSETPDDQHGSRNVIDSVNPLSSTGTEPDSISLMELEGIPDHVRGEAQSPNQTLHLPDSSSSHAEVEGGGNETLLPPGWSREVDRHGKEYYRDENTRVSTLYFPVRDPKDTEPLPLYWERRETRDGQIYYKNHKTHERTWIRPRDVVAASLHNVQGDVSDHANNAAVGNDEADASSTVANPDESVSDHTAQDSDPSTSSQSNTPPEPKDLFSNLCDWLWWTDDYNPSSITTTPRTLDDNALHDDIQPPPVVGNPLGRPAPPLVVAEQAPVANALNDDDVEDLEGLLELIGLEGPLAAMIQNLLFSIFLIMMTLIGFIWCPYVWGKIFLLLVAHPYSVFVKAPLYMLSRSADLLVDGLLFTFGLLGITLSQMFRVVLQALLPMVPRAGSTVKLQYAEDLFLSMSSKSGTRLEKVFSGAFLHMRPDLPTFSMQSHHVLRVFHAATIGRVPGLAGRMIEACAKGYSVVGWPKIFEVPVVVAVAIRDAPASCVTAYTASTEWLKGLQTQLKPLTFGDPDHIDYTLIEWTSKEKVMCIFLGYILGHIAGYIYLRVAHWYYGLSDDEKVDTFVADILRQAGGVTKVVVIIGFEMIVYPLYCGLVLNVAMLPLFADASVQSRINFLSTSPITAVFVHWFLGTCYMFHFALFVSMCRRIFRKGVLYFLRDTDDPSFHPVRDVLERPVLTQLGRLLLSALIYGGFLISCQGALIRAIDKFGGVLPIQWTSLEPVVAFPFDIVFYNFMLPFIIQKTNLSGKISALFTWWFRACASALRLTDFLFGDNNEDEKLAAFIRWRSFGKHLLRRKTGTQVVKELDVEVDNLALIKHTRKSIMVEVLDGPITEQVIRGLFKPEQTITAVTLQPLQQRAFVRFKHSAYVKAIMDSDLGSDIINSHGTFRISIIATPHAIRSLRDKPIDQEAGTYVRAPAVDSVKIPKGTKVFLPVTERNIRKDGRSDSDLGLHGRKDPSFTKVYIPSNFKARITAFICLVWLFASITGLLCTIGPLLVGRVLLRRMFHIVSAPNDLYALTVGVHVCGIALYGISSLVNGWSSSLHRTKSVLVHTRELLPKLLKTTKYVLGLLYMVFAFGLVLPLMISLVTEFYIHVPIVTYLIRRVDLDDTSATTTTTSSNMTSLLFSDEAMIATRSNTSLSQLSLTTPTIYLLQTWAIGLLYLRFLLRIVTKTEPANRVSHAVKSILRNGYLQPDIYLATRAVIIPLTLLSTMLIGLPLWFARIYLVSSDTTDAAQQQEIYRLAYPAVLLVLTSVYLIVRVRHSLARWRTRIRDEVYLIGERLHNLPRHDSESNKNNKHPIVNEAAAADQLRQNLRRRYQAGELGQPDAPETIPAFTPHTSDADEAAADLSRPAQHLPIDELDPSPSPSPSPLPASSPPLSTAILDSTAKTSSSNSSSNSNELYAGWNPEIRDLLEDTHRDIMGQELVRAMIGDSNDNDD